MRWIPLESRFVFYHKYVGVRWTFPNCHANIERRTWASTIYLLHTVGRSRSTASTVASCCPAILMYTRAHTLVTTDYTLYAHASVNRSHCRSNNSYDYEEKRGGRTPAKPLTCVLSAKNRVDITRIPPRIASLHIFANINLRNNKEIAIKMMKNLYLIL